MKGAVRSAVRRAGLDLVRYPGNAPGPTLAKLLRHHRVDVVFDVGANQGQYGRQLRTGGFQGRIVSFEPVIEAYRELAAHAGADPNWVAVHAAVGREAGSVTINVAANHAESSSVLPMLAAHVEAAPHAQYVGEETVSQVALDDLWQDYAASGDRIMLKADVQGYEREVVAGATRLFNAQAVGAHFEMSLTPLYEGGPLYREIIDIALDAGMELELVIPGHQNPETGRMIQMDGVFFRPLA